MIGMAAKMSASVAKKGRNFKQPFSWIKDKNLKNKILWPVEGEDGGIPLALVLPKVNGCLVSIINAYALLHGFLCVKLNKKSKSTNSHSVPMLNVNNGYFTKLSSDSY